ncbi:hypothetical protein FQA39_LY09685 [Lamprigera yunnana]|nr:hypothetical protein FQA39_LY09685 [Lamprigera yunnana]
MKDRSEDKIYAATATTIISIMSALKKKKQQKRNLWAKNWLKRRETGKNVLDMLNNELLVEDPKSYAYLTTPLEHVLKN